MFSVSAIRNEVEARLAERVPAPFMQRVRQDRSTISTGIDAIDKEAGGIPCGAITEIVASPWTSSGQRTIQMQLLACATQQQFCALIDATDSFDPRSAEIMGVDIQKLLWVRCSGKGLTALEQAFKCADLLLQGSGGFGAIVVDVSGIAERSIHKVPLTTWFRFSRVVERLETALVFSTPCHAVGTCSALTLTLHASEVKWSETKQNAPSHGRIFAGFDFALEVGCRRLRKKPVQAGHTVTYSPRWA